MQSDEDILQELKRCISEIERETGTVPDLELISRKMGISVTRLRRFIAQYLLKEPTEGTSAFHVSLREILLGNKSAGVFTSGQIRDREVRLIDADGTPLGIVPTMQALQIARDKGLDLFLIQPDANPPVARIMDYGKFKYEQEKRAHEVRKKHHVVDVKEIKMRYEIDDHDYQVKLRKGQEFLSNGDKIKVVITLRGREIQHAELAIALVNRFADELGALALIDREPILEGKSVIMTLAPDLRTRGK